MDRWEARGQNGSVAFDGVAVTVVRRGAAARMSGGGARAGAQRRIPVDELAGVELRAAGALVSGFIRFRAAAGGERRARGVAGDENAVVFGRAQEAQFTALRDAVEGALSGGSLEFPEARGSVGDELTKLARLVELELLTREEFEEQKAKLLRG